MDREERRKIIRELAGKHFSRIEEKVDGRAHEPYMKKEILDRVFLVWEENPDMRLGQLILNALGDHPRNDLYYMEDFNLIGTIEEYYEHRKTL
jgi:hypothetical protein